MATQENHEPAKMESAQAGRDDVGRDRIMLVIAFLVVGAGLSGLLQFDHHGISSAGAAVDQLCGQGDDSGCDQVAQSPYSRVGGVSLAALGAFFYAAMILLACLSLPASKEVQRSATVLLLYLMALAVGMDIILLGLQAFVIEAYCRLCIATYGINGAALILLMPARDAIPEAPAVWRGTAGRATLTAWGLGCVAALVSVGAVEYVLGADAGRRESAIVGALSADSFEETEPAPAAAETEAAEATAPASGPDAAGLQQQLARARAETARLRGILDDQEKYQQYRLEKQTEEFEQAPRQQLDLAGVPFKGSIDAPLHLVEYSDFLCSYCRSFAAAVGKYQAQMKGKLVVFYKNYPLDQTCNPGLRRTVHPGACNLALGAICAQESDRFWAYHDKVFQRPPKNASVDDVVAAGVSVGLDAREFRSCVGSPSTQQELARQVTEAKKVGVKSTPSVFLNNKKLPNVNVLLKAVESESKRLGI